MEAPGANRLLLVGVKHAYFGKHEKEKWKISGFIQGPA